MPRAVKGKKVTKSKRLAKGKKEEVTIEETSASVSLKDRLLSLPFLGKKSIFIYLFVGGIIILAIFGGKFLVVAWVDKKPVTLFEMYNRLNTQYGKDMREQLIVEKLLAHEAQTKGVFVTDNEIQSEIKRVEEEQGGPDKLAQILELQGISKDDLNRLIKLNLLRQKLFGREVTTSEEEISKYMEENKTILQTQYPDSETEATVAAKMKKDVSEQLKMQKVTANFNSWLQEALKSSRVVRL